MKETTTTDRSLAETWLAAYQSIRCMTDALRDAGDDDGTREDARQTIIEDPLEVTVRSDWHTPNTDHQKPAEFCILLSTGGPASRIIGTLTEHGQPEMARLEVQDWGAPWVGQWGTAEVQAALGDGAAEVTEVLLAYAREFYFGE
jgi:hypothetical protein